MFPNQQYPPPGAPYPPQAPYNPSGVHPQQQQQQQPPFGTTPSYGSGAGPAGYVFASGAWRNEARYFSLPLLFAASLRLTHRPRNDNEREQKYY